MGLSLEDIVKWMFCYLNLVAMGPLLDVLLLKPYLNLVAILLYPPYGLVHGSEVLAYGIVV